MTTAALILIAVASGSAMAQSLPAVSPSGPAAPQRVPGDTAVFPNARIAFIDPGMFEDKKAGIKRYLDAVKPFRFEPQRKYPDLIHLPDRIKALADEITKLRESSVVDPKAIQVKQEEVERMESRLKHIHEQATADGEQVLKTVLGPVRIDIDKALRHYAIQHGLTMILHLGKFPVVMMDPSADITEAFIADYNSKNP